MEDQNQICQTAASIRQSISSCSACQPCMIATGAANDPKATELSVILLRDVDSTSFRHHSASAKSLSEGQNVLVSQDPRELPFLVHVKLYASRSVQDVLITAVTIFDTTRALNMAIKVSNAYNEKARIYAAIQ